MNHETFLYHSQALTSRPQVPPSYTSGATQVPPSAQNSQLQDDMSQTALCDIFPEIPRSTIECMLKETGSAENVLDQLVEVPSSNMPVLTADNPVSAQTGLSVGSAPCSMMKHQQVDVSCNDDVTRLNALFPNRVAEIPNIFGALNYDFKATVDFFLNYSDNSSSNSTISFSSNTIPDVQGSFNENSINLSRSQAPIQGGSSTSTTGIPGRRPQRCEYCGNEWPSLDGNNYCSYCGMRKQRFRY